MWPSCLSPSWHLVNIIIISPHHDIMHVCWMKLFCQWFDMYKMAATTWAWFLLEIIDQLHTLYISVWLHAVTELANYLRVWVMGNGQARHSPVTWACLCWWYTADSWQVARRQPTVNQHVQAGVIQCVFLERSHVTQSQGHWSVSSVLSLHWTFLGSLVFPVLQLWRVDTVDNWHSGRSVFRIRGIA